MPECVLQNIEGSAMIRVPPEALSVLGWQAGDVLSCSVTSGGVLLHKARGRRKINLDDLLDQYEAAASERAAGDREWLNAPPCGRELI
ncbi:hypothetical protein [Sutterella sp.]|uniref:AbrB/MazE/SpoVT family DNA-binding domain-containing protein n=1 Tax=Sutterella sp. TaxID=1981025 RepID=UPI0026E06D8F|nr:hypothetical protein [Sutterella sp.]MDO5532166.1 hypothetical protein [Sutterella sp.]